MQLDLLVDVVMVVYHLLYELLVFVSVWVGGLGWWAGENRVSDVTTTMIITIATI
jgi:hypothetical protein